MKDTLDSLVRDAFPAEGEASATTLRFAARQKRATPWTPARRALVAVCALLLLTASAVTAQSVLGYRLLFENGRLVGTVTQRGQGVFILNFDKVRIPEDGTPLTLEVRDDSGRVVETMSIGRTSVPLTNARKENR